MHCTLNIATAEVFSLTVSTDFRPAISDVNKPPTVYEAKILFCDFDQALDKEYISTYKKKWVSF